MRWGALFTVVIGFFFSVPSLARDIDPEGNFGFVVIQVPKEAESEFKNFYVQFSKPGVGQTDILEFGKPFKVFAGTGCLAIHSRRVFSFVSSRCGLVVESGKTLTVPVGLLTLAWEKAATWVDVGPRPQFSFSLNKPENLTFFPERVSADPQGDKPPALLVHEGEYVVNYTGVAPLAGESNSFRISGPQAFRVDITPPDRRTEVIVRSESLKYPNPARRHGRLNDVFLMEESQPHSPPINWTTELATARAISKLAFQFEAPTRPSLTPVKSFRVFAIPASGAKSRHALSVNGVVVPLDLTPGKPKVVELVSLNVNLIDGNKKGFFRVFTQNPDSRTVERPIRWENVDKYADGNYAASISETDNDSDSRSPYIRTMHSLLVPPGFKYLIRTYAFDAVGEFKPQSEHVADLR